MVKRKSGSSQREKAAKKKGRFTKDEDIDFSDLPELTDDQLGSMKRIGRPLFGILPRRLIAIRIDPQVLGKLRQLAEESGKGYQTLINEILAKFVKAKSA